MYCGAAFPVSTSSYGAAAGRRDTCFWRERITSQRQGMGRYGKVFLYVESYKKDRQQSKGSCRSTYGSVPVVGGFYYKVIFIVCEEVNFRIV